MPKLNQVVIGSAENILARDQIYMMIHKSFVFE